MIYHYVSISTHTSRVGCDPNIFSPSFSVKISTHTSRVGCDFLPLSKSTLTAYFYSHIPCGMWRCRYRIKWRGFQFLLTHPVWDVTVPVAIKQLSRFISTHTSRVGCDSSRIFSIASPTISTHTSRVGCDASFWIRSFNSGEFLLTHPVWDVTRGQAESRAIQLNFYSHIPCGMWLLTGNVSP